MNARVTFPGLPFNLSSSSSPPPRPLRPEYTRRMGSSLAGDVTRVKCLRCTSDVLTSHLARHACTMNFMWTHVTSKKSIRAKVISAGTVEIVIIAESSIDSIISPIELLSRMRLRDAIRPVPAMYDVRTRCVGETRGKHLPLLQLNLPGKSHGYVVCIIGPDTGSTYE